MVLYLSCTSIEPLKWMRRHNSSHIVLSLTWMTPFSESWVAAPSDGVRAVHRTIDVIQLYGHSTYIGDETPVTILYDWSSRLWQDGTGYLYGHYLYKDDTGHFLYTKSIILLSLWMPLQEDVPGNEKGMVDSRYWGWEVEGCIWRGGRSLGWEGWCQARYFHCQ